ncbi:MAG: DNA polymerase III subunit delta [Candidatus Korobacteraceae bacterium]|jgi:DNA polymerase-3 subunit delta
MITTIVGTNSYTRKQLINSFVAPFIKQYGDFGYESIDGENVAFDQLQSALQNLPFLSVKKLIVLLKPSANKEFVNKIDQLLPTIPDSSDVIIVESKIDKRLHYFTTLKDQTKYHELQDPIGSDLVNWLITYVQDKNGHINPQLARQLIDRVGGNQLLLANELDKLLLYSSEISDQSIQLLVEITPQSTIFEMLDSAFAGDNQRTLDLYKEQRDLKVEPAQIVAMLTWQLHILALIKTATNLTAEQIAKEAHQNPFVIRKSLGLAKRIEQRTLQRMLKDLLALDIKLKTEAIDPDEALKYYLLTLH